MPIPHLHLVWRLNLFRGISMNRQYLEHLELNWSEFFEVIKWFVLPGFCLCDVFVCFGFHPP